MVEIAFAVFALLVLAGLVALGAGWLLLRRRFVAEVAARAARSERRRLAEDLHDLIGHDLALIAVRAGALELQHPGAVAQDAAQIRSATRQASDTLRELTGVLGADGADRNGRQAARTEPSGRSVGQLVAEAERAGVSVQADLAPTGDVSEAVRLTLVRVVREALTNATRHAPGEAVTIELTRGDGNVRLVVSNPVASGSDPGTGTGLGALRRRVELLGGELRAGVEDGTFTVRALLPASTRLPPVRATGGPRAPTVELIRTAWPYLATAAVAVLGFYTWAVQGSTVEPGPRAALRAGLSAGSAQALLPSRQAPVRLYASPAEPAGASCRYYTDGNFPFGLATVRICLAGGIVTSVDDLTRNRS